MTVLGEVLETTRRARGITQEQLAERVGITQAALSRYENGMREPEGEVVQELARALGVTTRFFEHAGRAKGAMAVDAHMRKRATAKATTWKQLEARLNVLRMHTSLLFEEVSLRADQHIPTFDPFEVTPSEAARMVRMQWRMPIGPVKNLIGWLEAAGCVVILQDFGTPKIDGMSQWIGGHPVMLLNSETPTDRRRLTVAHELGHLVLHASEVNEEMEEQANEFAAEFLMPFEVIRPQLRNVRVPKLHDLKRTWGVSMQSIIERAYRAKMLTPTERTAFYKQMSARGWRTREPGSDELPPEEPKLLGSIASGLRAKGFTDKEVAFMAGFSTPEENTVVVPPRSRLYAV
jgi:Zn-dependent peptidase ImmA (M78 family)/DNA-binding XRE family transcriptional regulator